MIKAVLALTALLGAGLALDAARAECLMCRCIYVSELGGAPIRTSGAFPARGARSAARLAMTGGLTALMSGHATRSSADIRCLAAYPKPVPNPPPYTRPFNREAFSFPG